MHSQRKDNKGFSLVELIIVMAIMVVLVAVLAPQFVKYVQRARNTVVMDAANQALDMVKAEYAMQTLQFADGADEALVRVEGHEGHLKMKLTDLVYEEKTGEDADEAFMKACGVDENVETRSDVAYEITLKKSDHSISGAVETASIEVEMEQVN